MAKKKADLTINGDEIYIVVDGDGPYIFREAILPGCKLVGVNPYIFETDDGKQYITMQFARKKAK